MSNMAAAGSHLPPKPDEKSGGSDQGQKLQSSATAKDGHTKKSLGTAAASSSSSIDTLFVSAKTAVAPSKTSLTLTPIGWPSMHAGELEPPPLVISGLSSTPLSAAAQALLRKSPVSNKPLDVGTLPPAESPQKRPGGGDGGDYEKVNYDDAPMLRRLLGGKGQLKLAKVKDSRGIGRFLLLDKPIALGENCPVLPTPDTRIIRRGRRPRHRGWLYGMIGAALLSGIAAGHVLFYLVPCDYLRMFGDIR